MNIEEIIEKCEISLKQIKQYDPDPFYVNHFFLMLPSIILYWKYHLFFQIV